MAESLYTQVGIIRFYDGTVIAIERQEYSPDGITNWETIFNPNDHLSTLDGVTPIDGHKYKRVMHSGDTDWQLPYKIVAETPEFRVTDTALEWKFEDETTWNHLLYLTEIQGEQGEQGEMGVPGEGLNINLYGFIMLRPDCSASLVSSCNSCNPAGNTDTTSSTLFMSLGDGVLEITQAIITATNVDVGGVTYSHFSNDLITWTALTAGIVGFNARYLSTSGTGAVYTDMRTEDYYGSRGVVYACAEGMWTVLTDVTAPSYMVGEAFGNTNIGFLDNFILASANNLVGTISLDAGKLEVIEQSLTENALIQTMFGDGINIVAPMAKPQIAPNDFIGFGLVTYISDTDSLLDIQVDAINLSGDGISPQAAVAQDGEVRNLFGVDLSDIINNDSGIIAVTQGDTFDDLVINIGLGLTLDGGTPQAIDVNVDDASLEVDATSLRIKPFNATSANGVKLIHLNTDIAYTNQGIELDVLNGLKVKVDTEDYTIGWNGAGEIAIPDNAIQGDKLNDNVANDALGIKVINDQLEVLIDDVTIGFNVSGELEYKGLAGAAVVSIGDGIAIAQDVILLTYTQGGLGSIDASWTVNGTTDEIDLTIEVNTAWLDMYLIANPPVVTPAEWGSINTGTGVASQTDLVAYITSLEHVVLDTWYGNAQVSTINGLVLRSGTGGTDASYKVIVDANGNLDTVLIP